MDAWFQFVYVSKRPFSSNILLQHFSFPLQFFILHSTNKEADDAQVNRKGSGLKSRLANQTRSVVWWWWSNLTSVFTGVVPNAELSGNRLLRPHPPGENREKSWYGVFWGSCIFGPLRVSRNRTHYCFSHYSHVICIIWWEINHTQPLFFIVSAWLSVKMCLFGP